MEGSTHSSNKEERFREVVSNLEFLKDLGRLQKLRDSGFLTDVNGRLKCVLDAIERVQQDTDVPPPPSISTVFSSARPAVMRTKSAVENGRLAQRRRGTSLQKAADSQGKGTVYKCFGGRREP